MGDGMKVYISGAITGQPDMNRQAFYAAEKRLKAKGYEPINPHKICREIEASAPHGDFMDICLPALRESDAFILLLGTNWRESKGVQLEMVEAGRHGIPLVSLDWLETVKPYKAAMMLLEKELRRER